MNPVNYSKHLLASLQKVSDRDSAIFILTAGFGTPASNTSVEQVGMNKDLLFFAQFAVQNLAFWKRQNILMLTEAEYAESVCTCVQISCGYQTSIVPHADWHRRGLTQNHFYILFLQRWRLVLRVLHFGYTALSLDTDIFWTSDPYRAIVNSITATIDAAFSSDEPFPLNFHDNKSVALNSGVMFARPSAAPLFDRVVRRLLQRHTNPRQSSKLFDVWPQNVLNEVVEESRTGHWTALIQNTGHTTGAASTDKTRIGVLGHRVVSRICGRRLKYDVTNLFWGRSLSKNCTLSPHQVGFHAQMVHPETRTALWTINHPQQSRRTLVVSDEFASIAMSSTLTRWTCICRGTECRMMTGIDSYRAAIKSCKNFIGANPGA